MYGYLIKENMREVTMLDAEPVQTTFMQKMNSHTGTNSEPSEVVQ
jgi:hypothetical protein